LTECNIRVIPSAQCGTAFWSRAVDEAAAYGRAETRGFWRSISSPRRMKLGKTVQNSGPQDASMEDAQVVAWTPLDKLSASRTKMLRMILENPADTFFLSSRELAKRYDVDVATIVRTIQALGYGKFAEFAADLRSHFIRSFGSMPKDSVRMCCPVPGQSDFLHLFKRPLRAGMRARARYSRGYTSCASCPILPLESESVQGSSRTG